WGSAGARSPSRRPPCARSAPGTRPPRGRRPRPRRRRGSGRSCAARPRAGARPRPSPPPLPKRRAPPYRSGTEPAGPAASGPKGHRVPTRSAPVLVTGATGKQGGATARALLAAGVDVRALVRDPSTDRAAALAALGAELVTGDLRDRESLVRSAEGARAVFSVQMAKHTGAGFDFDGEVVQGVNLVEAARAAGVPQFVHTSVTGAGRHTDHAAWAPGRWAVEPALTAKSAIQDAVRSAGFPRWTIIKPGFFMDNFRPAAAFLFPRGVEGGLVSVLWPRT